MIYLFGMSTFNYIMKRLEKYATRYYINFNTID